jgi:hypothetical protein
MNSLIYNKFLFETKLTIHKPPPINRKTDIIFLNLQNFYVVDRINCKAK